MLKRFYYQVLIMGNIKQDDSLQIVSELNKKFSADVLPKEDYPKRQLLKVPEGEHVFQQANFDKGNQNSAICNYYQIGEDNTKENILTELLSQVLKDDCFNQLRTKEQLGYTVWSSTSRFYGVQAYRIIIQSTVQNPTYLDSRIESFLNESIEKIKKMEDTEFKNNIAALATKKLESDKKLSEEASRYWHEILTGTYKFDRVPIEVEELYKVTQQELVEFIEKYISAQSKQRRKLSIQVFGNGHLNFMYPKTIEVPENGIIEDSENRNIKHIVDVTKFKKTANFYTLANK